MKTNFEDVEEIDSKSSKSKISEKEFNEIYDKYYKNVYYSAWKIVRNPDDAEELTQDVFEYYYKRPDLYDGKHPIEAYLVFLTKRRAITYGKKKERRNDIENEHKQELLKDEYFDGADKVLERKDEIKFVREELSKLKPEYRDVIMLVYFQNKSYKEAAEILGKSETTIKVTLHRAKAKLRENIERKGLKEYLLSFLIIALVILGLSCTYNIAKNKLFKNPKSYTYNDNSIEVNIEVLERYKRILDALNIRNDGSIKAKYIPTSKDNKDLLEIYNDEFKLIILDDEIMEFALANEQSSINVLNNVDETTVLKLDRKLFNDEIIETRTVANEAYKMININVNNSESRIYVLSNENKVMKIRNMKSNYIENSIEFNKESVEKIVKEEYGDEIEIKNIELTQTKLNTVVNENNMDMFFEKEEVSNYRNLNFANKDFNFYLVWQVTFTKKNEEINKMFWIYIDTYTGEIVKNSTYMESK